MTHPTTTRGDSPLVAGPLDSVRLLWPAAGPVTRRPVGSRSLLVLPTAAAPRILVPAGVPAAATMLRRHAPTRRRRWGQALAEASVRTRLVRWLPVERLPLGDPAVESIGDVLGRHVAGSAALGVLLGPPRANAKPVIQVFGAAGETLAFVKVGVDPSTAALVRREAAVLADPALRTVSTIEVPDVLHAGAWGDLELLALSPMRAAQTRSTGWELPVPEMVAVATSTPTAVGPLREHLGVVQARIDGRPGPEHALGGLVAAVAGAVGSVEVTYGRWHGDWAPWNTGRVGGRLQLWDWEQSAVDVPCGFDALHLVTQDLLRRDLPAEPFAASVVAGAAPVLRHWSDAESVHRALALAYLVEVVDRYARQRAAGGGSQALTRRVERLTAVAAVLLAGGRT